MSFLTPEEIITIDAYNKHAKAWVTTHDDDDFYKPEYLVLKRLLPQGKLLDIGCGAGRDAVQLQALGYDYVGTDVAENLVKEAKKRSPNAKFITTDLYSMQFDEKFDGFWCAAVLLHIPRERIKEALACMRSQIRIQGIGFISTKMGTSNELEPLPYDPSSSRLQVHYSKEEFDTLLKQSGFSIIDYTLKQVSERGKWMCYFVKKV